MTDVRPCCVAKLSYGCYDQQKQESLCSLSVSSEALSRLLLTMDFPFVPQVESSYWNFAHDKS